MVIGAVCSPRFDRAAGGRSDGLDEFDDRMLDFTVCEWTGGEV